MVPKTGTRLRNTGYILLFVAACFAVLHVAFWSGQEPSPSKPMPPLEAGQGSAPLPPSPRQ